MSAAQTTAPLIDAPVTERDYQMRAFQRLQAAREDLRNVSFEAALAHPSLGKLVRAFGKSIQNLAELQSAQAERAAKYGQPVEFNGYGYRRKLIPDKS